MNIAVNKANPKLKNAAIAKKTPKLKNAAIAAIFYFLFFLPYKSKQA